jgi:hypothetical protein
VPSDAIVRIRSEIAERLEVMQQEQERLRAALAALDGADSGSISAGRRTTSNGRRSRASVTTAPPKPAKTSPPKRARRQRGAATTKVAAAIASVPAATETPGRPKASASAKTRSPRQRAPRGHNREVVLAAVTREPGLTASKVATAAGLKRTDMVYPLLNQLVELGAIQKRELDGEHPTYTATTAA